MNNPAKPIAIVVLTKFKDIVTPFIESVNQFEPDVQIFFVLDQGDIQPEYLTGQRSSIIMGPECFAMAGNGNLGLKNVPADHDVLYLGDDIRFIEKDTIKKLQEVAYSDEKIGILSPRLIGRGSPSLVNPMAEVCDVRPLEMWFPCVYIKREVLDKVGFLDEEFNDFGSDDLDYCIRTKLLGYRLCVTNKAVVKHEASPEGGPTTFVKKLGVATWQKQEAEAFTKLKKKYKVSDKVFNKFLVSGNVDILKDGSKEEESEEPKTTLKKLPKDRQPTNEEMKAYLRSRHLYLATPAYGGMMTVNYVQSVLSLMNLCIQYGIKMNTGFMYNESLITRARNKMVADFMETEATDFFFIDADIGFQAENIITLMLYEGDIIGAPCSRKSLRLEHLSQVIKKNSEKEYSKPEMEKLLGEYCINFPHGQIPARVNLAELQEVMEVGTGLMYVKRETFEKFNKAYPDGWFLPMGGEEGAPRTRPIYMYFQAAVDEETKKHNPGGYGDYISEDYWFCRKARRAGMKVFLAPWMATTHLGSYVFQADLVSASKLGGAIR